MEVPELPTPSQTGRALRPLLSMTTQRPGNHTYRSESAFAGDVASRRIRWSGVLPEGANWKSEHKFSLAEVLWYNIRHAGLHE